MTERTEEARAAGFLHLTIGGQPVDLPVLKMRASREWRAQLDAAELSDDVSDFDGPMEMMLDLLVSYDRMGILGGRESLEDRATDPEIYAAFREVLAAAFPFVENPETMLRDDFTRRVIGGLFLRASSTNGRSTPGASTPTPLKSASPKSSSSSSTRRARSA